MMVNQTPKIVLFSPLPSIVLQPLHESLGETDIDIRLLVRFIFDRNTHIAESNMRIQQGSDGLGIGTGLMTSDDHQFPSWFLNLA